MPYGRGGAGNIAMQEQVKKQNEKISEDIEAQRSLASNAAPPPSSAPSQSQPQEYAHMGRGGAGNWYQPTELEKEGNFTTSGDATSAPTASRPNISTPWHPEDQELPVARAGRGGAGNFVWKDEEKERKRIEDEEAARGKLSEKVEHDVEQGLAKPGAAVLGGVKGGRGW